jgi:hypothetical protein
LSADIAVVYLQTDAPITAVVEAANSASAAQYPGQSTRVFNTVDEANSAVQSAGATRQIFIYQEHEGLYTLWVVQVIAPADLLDANPEWYSQEIGKRGKTWALMDSFLKSLSATLKADAALMAYSRNPAQEITSILLYRSGRYIDEYYILSGDDPESFVQPKNAGAVSELFDGRFAFLNEPPLYEPLEDDSGEEDEDEHLLVHFQGENLMLPVSTADFPYQQDVSRLYLPFYEDLLTPYAVIQLH